MEDELNHLRTENARLRATNGCPSCKTNGCDEHIHLSSAHSGELAKRVAELERAVKAVRFVHAEYEGRCVTCKEHCDCLDLDDNAKIGDCTHGDAEWPCATIRQLDAPHDTAAVWEVTLAEAAQQARLNLIKAERRRTEPSHCGLCGSEGCPGVPGKGCMPGPFEAYAPAVAGTGEQAAPTASDRVVANHPWLTEPLGDSDALALHLVSAHGDVMALNRSYEENNAAHAAEHNGPGTIRNHDRSDRTYDEQKLAEVVAECREMDGAAVPVASAELTRHGWTSHGYACCGRAQIGGRPSMRARCMGNPRCRKCKAEADQIHGTDANAEDGR